VVPIPPAPRRSFAVSRKRRSAWQQRDPSGELRKQDDPDCARCLGQFALGGEAGWPRRRHCGSGRSPRHRRAGTLARNAQIQPAGCRQADGSALAPGTAPMFCVFAEDSRPYRQKDQSVHSNALKSLYLSTMVHGALASRAENSTTFHEVNGISCSLLSCQSSLIDSELSLLIVIHLKPLTDVHCYSRFYLASDVLARAIVCVGVSKGEYSCGANRC
jgi:hypothetical protein